MEELLTDEVMVRHPRSLLILASLEAVLATQILVLGLIARFYEGVPWGTALWVPVFVTATAIAGFVFLKWKSPRWLLYAYALATLVSLLLTLFLFIVTASLLSKVRLAPTPTDQIPRLTSI